jgi:hypothetical protein
MKPGGQRVGDNLIQIKINDRFAFGPRAFNEPRLPFRGGQRIQQSDF